jgi:hypothetical protein
VLLSHCHRAIESVWGHEEPPIIAIVLGSRFCQNEYAHMYSRAFHLAAGGFLTEILGIADPGERQATIGILPPYSPGSLDPKIRVFFNKQATHSVVRWLDPVGDRTIVVLPPAYDIT